MCSVATPPTAFPLRLPGLMTRSWTPLALLFNRTTAASRPRAKAPQASCIRARDSSRGSASPALTSRTLVFEPSAWAALVVPTFASRWRGTLRYGR
jgi:hypothetical protein